jgi:hypothetical protein
MKILKKTVTALGVVSVALAMAMLVGCNQKSKDQKDQKGDKVLTFEGIDLRVDAKEPEVIYELTGEGTTVRQKIDSMCRKFIEDARNRAAKGEKFESYTNEAGYLGEEDSQSFCFNEQAEAMHKIASIQRSVWGYFYGLVENGKLKPDLIQDYGTSVVRLAYVSCAKDAKGKLPSEMSECVRSRVDHPNKTFKVYIDVGSDMMKKENENWPDV